MSGSGTFNANATALFGTLTQRTMAGTTFNLASAGTWEDGNFAMDAGSVFNIQATQALTITDAAAALIFRSGVTVGEVEPVLNINGSLTKAVGSTQTTSLDVTTNIPATGSINVPAGSVDMGFANTIAGTLNPTGAGVVEIDGSAAGLSHDFNAGSAVTGDGTFQVSAGVVNFNDSHNIAATFLLSNGTVNVLTATSLNANGPFNWNSGTLRGPGTLNANGTATFQASVTRTIQGATLNLNSDGEWVDGNIAMDASSVFAIADGNTLTVTDAGAATVFRSGVGVGETEPVLNVNGVLTKTITSAGTTSLDVMTNVGPTGTISAQAGSFNMGFASAVEGTFNPTGGGIVQIDGSAAGLAHNFNAGFGATGDGTFQVLTGIVNFNDTHAIAPAFSFLNGTVNLFGTVNANGPVTWNAGTLSNNGTFNANDVTTFGTTATRTMTGSTFNLGADGTWADGSFGMDGGSVFNLLQSNTLTITDTGGSTIFRSGVGAGEIEPQVNISGTLVKALTSTLVHSIDVTTTIGTTGVVNPMAGAIDFGFESFNHGLVQIDASAEVDFDGGTHTNETDGTIAGDGIHRVANAVTFNNLGTYAPGASAGSLAYVGNYNQTAPTATFNVEIGGTTPGTQHDVRGARVFVRRSENWTSVRQLPPCEESGET